MSLMIVNSEQALSRCIGDLREQWKVHKFLRVTTKTGKDRSLDQNAISHAWYEQVALELREDTAAEVKRYCKLHHGVPILRAEDPEFREFYDKAIKGLTYEQKLKAMDFVPVTSEMKVKQLSQYLVEVRNDFRADVRDNKVMLEFPPEDK